MIYSTSRLRVPGTVKLKHKINNIQSNNIQAEAEAEVVWYPAIMPRKIVETRKAREEKGMHTDSKPYLIEIWGSMSRGDDDDLMMMMI